MTGAKVNNKRQLRGIALIIHNSKGTWYLGLLAATLIILSVAISAEFSPASSKAYAEEEEEQIYKKTQMLHKPILLTSIGIVEQQQGTQMPTQKSNRNATVPAIITTKCHNSCV